MSIDNTNTSITITPRQLFEREDVQERFKNILGKKAPGFIVSVINCINDNELLQKADQNSILFAAANAAVLDLPINQNLGFAYIIPYNKKQKDGTFKTLAQFQLGYKGFIQLAQRSGQFKTINATDVREGELETFDRLTGEIKFKWCEEGREKLKVIGYVSYFSLLNGFNKLLYMTTEELNIHGNKYSQSSKKGYGLWKDDFDAMASKTVIKLLLSKYAPLSIDMQRAIVTDQAILNDWEGKALDYVDNDDVKLDPDAVSEVKEQNRIKEFIKNCKSGKELKENCGEYCDKLAEDNEIKIMYMDKLLTF